jgi:hypothetical protein
MFRLYQVGPIVAMFIIMAMVATAMVAMFTTSPRGIDKHGYYFS